MDAYIRVSRVGGRDKEDSEAYQSPDIQRIHIETTAKLKGIEIGKILEDQNVSGSKAVASRKLEELIQRAEQGISAGVIVYRITRFGRDAAETLLAIKRLHDAGTRLVTADGIDSSTGTGKLIVGILASLAEYELDSITASWAAATAGAVNRGIHISAKVPMGYVRGDDRRLVPDPEAAAAVRETFELRASGKSHGEVTEFLRERLGRGVAKSSVTHMLSNRVYLGEARGGSNGDVHKGAHEALVSDDLFNRVQARRGARTLRDGSLTGQAMLGGLIRCASCGYKLRIMGSTDRKGRRRASYVCATKYASGICEAPAAGLVERVDEHVIALLADSWDEVTASARSAEQRYLEAREAVRQAEVALDAWVDDPGELFVQLGKERFRRGVLKRQEALEAARRTMYELEDVQLPDGPLVTLDGTTPVLYEAWGDDRERDRARLRAAIAKVTLAKADPDRRKGWQPISERVRVRWVGEAGD